MTTDYFIADGESDAETERLLQLHTCLARYLGNVAADLLVPSAGQQVLDVGCGPGGWVLDLAERVPQAQMIGIDVSPTRIAFAQRLASARGLSHTRFLLMDAAKPLGWPSATFDLVHARFAQSFLPAAAWPAFLAECLRVLRPGGRLVLVECENPISTSRAFECLCVSYAEACQKAGTAVTPCGAAIGITAALASWLQQAGYQRVEDRIQALDFSAGMPAHEDLVHYFHQLLPLALPFLLRQGVLTPQEGTQLCQQALWELTAPDLCGIWYFRTVWGSRLA